MRKLLQRRKAGISKQKNVYSTFVGCINTGLVFEDVILGARDAVVGSVSGAVVARKVAQHALVRAVVVGTEGVPLILAQILLSCLRAFVNVDASKLIVPRVTILALRASQRSRSRAGALARLVALGTGDRVVHHPVLVVALSAGVAQLSGVARVALALAVALAGPRTLAPPMPIAWLLCSASAGITVGSVVVLWTAGLGLLDAQELVQVGLPVLRLEPPGLQIVLVLLGQVAAVFLAFDYLQAEVLLDFDEPNLTLGILFHVLRFPVNVSSIVAAPFCSLNAVLKRLDNSLAGLASGQNIFAHDPFAQIADVYGRRKLHFRPADGSEANEKKPQCGEEES